MEITSENREYRTTAGLDHNYRTAVVSNLKYQTEAVLNHENPTAEDLKKTRCKFFRLLGIPTILFAIVTAFLLRDGYTGINITIEAAAAVLYSAWIIKRAGIMHCRGSRLIQTVILLLGFSCFLTGNEFLQAINTAGIFFLLLLFLVLNFRRPASDSFTENTKELVIAPLHGIAGLGNSFKDTAAFVKNEKNGWKKLIPPVLTGLAVSVPLITVILLLLCSADAVFREMFSGLTGQIFWFPVTMFISALLWFIFTYSTVRRLREHQSAAAGQTGSNIREQTNVAEHCGKANSVIGITICLPVTLIYLVFSVVQIMFLFLRSMNLPDGYSYADYVHEGFYQLLAACILNLILVIFMKEYFRKSRVLDILLTVIGGCTYIMTASSILRTVMYVLVYGLTFLRVMVLWSLAVIAILFTGVLIRIWNTKYCLFRFMLVTVFAAWLILSFSHIDHFIAVYDLYSTNAKDQPDLQYLSELSSDALPVLIEFADKKGFYDEEKNTNNYISPDEYMDLDSYLREDRSCQNWRGTNLSDIIAEKYRKHYF